MAESNDEIVQHVQQFVAEFWNEPVEKVQPSTRLSEDLGIDGDDASELIHAFQEHFEVDMTGFQFNAHFGSEGISLGVGFTAVAYAFLLGWTWGWKPWVSVGLGALAATLIIRQIRQENPNALRVQDLANSAADKRWVFLYKQK